MKEISLKISDIDCAACVERLNRALGAVNGVRAAAVNYASGRALISYDEDEASIASIAAAVKKAGFGVPADSVELKCPALDAETMSRALAALRAMEEGKIAVFGGGTGNPFFSTDTATALRAVEVSADVMFKATMVDGVYDKDPHKYPDAKKYDTLTFTKVLEDQLAVMDGTAATLCRDNKLPILVFDLAEPDNIAKAVQGENVGTLVYEG